MFFDEDMPNKKTEISIPRTLDTLSVDELEDYIEILKAEIARTEKDIDKKKSSRMAADIFFKQKE